jgi:hypothetical protein
LPIEVRILVSFYKPLTTPLTPLTLPLTYLPLLVL